MLDLEFVKQKSDLLALASSVTATRKIASSGGGEWAGPCPFCGGRDRFRIQPFEHRWLCRHCTDARWQDVIEFIARRDHLDPHQFHDLEAICTLATGSNYRNHLEPVNQSQVTETSHLPPSQEWQEAGQKFIEHSIKELWSDEGIPALHYLHNRGLADDTIRGWRIGYNPRDRFESLSSWGLEELKDSAHHAIWLPAGVVIPATHEKTIDYIKIRRENAQPKYIIVRGGQPALFGADNFSAADLILLTEGEFDALLTWQEVGDLVTVGTFGSATNTLISRQWDRQLDAARLILVAFDQDEAGEKGAGKLVAQYPNSYSLSVPRLSPLDKDITDFYLSGGELRSWLLSALDEFTMPIEWN
jgi:DNA primase